MDRANLESLMIFPLPDVVLFPGTRLPLHVFEPRYRTMLRDALDRERPIGLATIDDSGATDTYGRPLVRPYIGVGTIADWDELEDGRYLIVIEGVERALILDEYAPERPYRLVRAVSVPDEPGDRAGTATCLEVVRALILSMRNVNPRLAQFLGEELERHPDPAVFSNRIGAMVGHETASQYRMLETIRISDRMDAVVERISDILARMTAAPGGTVN